MARAILTLLLLAVVASAAATHNTPPRAGYRAAPGCTTVLAVGDQCGGLGGVCASFGACADAPFAAACCAEGLTCARKAPGWYHGCLDASLASIVAAITDPAPIAGATPITPPPTVTDSVLYGAAGAVLTCTANATSAATSFSALPPLTTTTNITPQAECSAVATQLGQPQGMMFAALRFVFADGSVDALPAVDPVTGEPFPPPVYAARDINSSGGLGVAAKVVSNAAAANNASVELREWALLPGATPSALAYVVAGTNTGASCVLAYSTLPAVTTFGDVTRLHATVGSGASANITSYTFCAHAPPPPPALIVAAVAAASPSPAPSSSPLPSLVASPAFVASPSPSPSPSPSAASPSALSPPHHDDDQHDGDDHDDDDDDRRLPAMQSPSPSPAAASPSLVTTAQSVPSSSPPSPSPSSRHGGRGEHHGRSDGDRHGRHDSNDDDDDNDDDRRRKA